MPSFFESELLIENTFLARHTRRKVGRGTVRAVLQVYDEGNVDGTVTHSWGLLIEAPGKLTLLADEEFEASA